MDLSLGSASCILTTKCPRDSKHLTTMPLPSPLTAEAAFIVIVLLNAPSPRDQKPYQNVKHQLGSSTKLSLAPDTL